MRESTTFQKALEEGRAEGRLEGRLEGARALFLSVAKVKFGPPVSSALDRIEAIDDMAQLKKLCVKFWKVESWEELLFGLEQTSRKAVHGRKS